MSVCEKLRPALFRVVEGEATPEEAMHAARHLDDCTACRILLARERRLAAMLEQNLEDPLQVGEGFVQSVMANLPKEPPPRPRRLRAKRRLRLASLAGLVGLLPLAAGSAPEFPAALGLPSLLAPSLEGTRGGLEGLVGLGQLLRVALDSMATRLPAVEIPWVGLAGMAGLIAVPALAAVAGGTTVLAVATHALLKAR